MRGLPVGARGDASGGDCSTMGETPGDAGPAVALTVTVGDDPLVPPVMLTATVPGGGGLKLTVTMGDDPLVPPVTLTATVPGGGGGGLSSGDTCISEEACIST